MKQTIFNISITLLLSIIGAITFSQTLSAQVTNPIVFVTLVPKGDDFGNIVSTFANHIATPQSAPRGGDLWIRYTDGTLRNLTAEAGFGSNGFQGANSITVRDPVVHWSGDKVLFSMVVGSPNQFEIMQHRFQLYEVTGIGQGQTARITRVPGQRAEYNNVMPAYLQDSDDSIVFASDTPRGFLSHLYPQLDEYESTPTNTGLWTLNPRTGNLVLRDHNPSGDFHPTVDSFGRIIFSRWDHLRQDQQADTEAFGAFNFENESAGARALNTKNEVFPEAGNELRRQSSNVNLHNINLFFPWMMSTDGTGLETLNHIGRHELTNFFPRTFTNDGTLTDFLEQQKISVNNLSIQNLFQIRESPTQRGLFYATNAPEFHTHGTGQIVTLNGSPDTPTNQMRLLSVTHPSTSAATPNPGPQHSGLYRNALPLTSGGLLAAHTSETRIDRNIGSRENPQSRYDYRIKTLNSNGTHFTAGAPLTGGIFKSVTYFDPDVLVSFSGNLWELQPVEVVARARPPVTSNPIPAIERNAFQASGVSLAEFQQYLVDRNLALVVSRDVTTRDEIDRQQPFRLRVGGNSGNERGVSGLRFYQADLVRGYTDFVEGRRPIARELNSVSVPNAFQTGQNATYQVEPDGSVAALVPAGRAMTWELINDGGSSIVKERFWVSFQPGEVRVCASCHGVNDRDQNGRGEPTNTPQALTKLLSIWKSDPNLVTVPEGTPPSGNVGAPAGLRLSRRVTRNGNSRILARVSGLSSSETGLSFQLLNRRGRVRRSKSFNANANGNKRVSVRVTERLSNRRLRGEIYRAGNLIASENLRRR